MRVYRYFLLLTIFLTSLFSNLWASYLQTADVHDTMEKLFSYHIDQKGMNQALMKRSLKIYMQNFDNDYSYLVLSEIDDFVNPTDAQVEKMVQAYENEDYSIFFQVNEKVRNSIKRARVWRIDWMKNSQDLVEKAKAVEQVKLENEGYANSIEGVKERHYNFFVHLIAFNIKKLDEKSYIGREHKVVQLAEKQMLLMENSYLGVNDSGSALSKEEQKGIVLLKMVKALASSLDAHTAFYSADEALAMRVQLEKGLCGIGVVLQEGIEGIVIAELLKGGPAQASGKLLVGDTIVKVDGVEVRDYSFSHILELMRGVEGSRMRLQVLRDQTPYDIDLVRSNIVLDDKRVDVTSEPFGEGIIGKITLHSFYEGADGINSESDLKEAISELKKKGPLYGLVLDLRGNGGGFLSQAVKVSGLFMKSGVVVIAKYSDGNAKYFRTFNRTKFYDGPLVVLISRDSASAAEIVAQTLQDYGVALVIGDEQTYGKGTIQHQTITDAESKSFFKVTVGRYYTVSGKSTQIEGVKADIVVPTKLNFEKVGEGFSEYPLAADRIESAYNDSLGDIDPQVRKWFKGHYTSGMQMKSEKWKDVISLFRKNSEERIRSNENFQAFLKTVRDKEAEEYGKVDLPMAEGVNILKDMIFLEQST